MNAYEQTATAAGWWMEGTQFLHDSKTAQTVAPDWRGLCDEQGLAPPKPKGEVAAYKPAGALTPSEALLGAALDPSIDLDRMQRLLDMRKALIEREEERAYVEAMAAAQAEMPAVLKNKENSQTRSNYASLDQIAAAVDPVLHRHGFGLAYGMEDSPVPGHYRITCKVDHVAGHSRLYRIDIPIDAAGAKGAVNKTATHAFGSTISYGRRYLKLMILDISTKDDNDGNREKDEPIVTAEQAAEIEAKIVAVGADREKFLEIIMCDDVAAIYASKFDAVMKLLDRKAEKQRGDK